MALLSHYSRIGLTGATGWLGRRVARALAEGVNTSGNLEKGPGDVVCLVPPQEHARELRGWGMEVIGGDVRDAEACRTFADRVAGGLIIHLAGIIHPPGRTRYFWDINLKGTQNILDAAAMANCRRLVVMSSNSPLGCNPSPEQVFTEDSPYSPYMGYGRSKWRMEVMLRDRMKETGAPEITIVRAPWFYGPGQPERQTTFFRMIRQGRFPIVGTGGNRRSMGYVDSLASGVFLAASKPSAAGQIYWLADKRPYPMAEIVDTVRAIMGEDFGLSVSQRTPRLPGFVGDMATVADGLLQSLGLYHQKVHVLSEMNKTIACDISKARRELGYEPLCGLREGMRNSIAWCLESGHEF